MKRPLVIPEELHRNHPDVHASGPEHSGATLIKLVSDRLGLADLSDCDVLDVGCGVRFTQAIVNRDIPIGSYTGIDVHRPLIEYLRQEVDDPRFSFAHWDAHNAKYNPTGLPISRESRLPIEGTFDVIWLFSVFTHLAPPDADALLAILRRHVRPQGALFFSAFVDDTVGTFEDRLPEYPLSHACYSERYLRELLAANGWSVASLSPPSRERFIQHSLLCRPMTSDARPVPTRRAGTNPVVVAGMHRSGTSLAATLIAKLGISIGEALLPEDRNNPRGYYEDISFLELNRRMLAAAVAMDDGGHPDWGWTEHERFDADRLPSFEDEARRLIAKRVASQRRWGWKDPRTTVLLDFWHPLLEDPFYLLVYRLPWEVADSMQRLGAAVFLNRPDYAYGIWTFYNRRMLDFCLRHRERCLLVSTDALLRDPQWLVHALAARGMLDLDKPVPLSTHVDDALFEQLADDDPLVSLICEAHPECRTLLEELDRHADLSAEAHWQVTNKHRVVVASGRPPRISVVIPCLDQGEFLLEALASFERCVPEPRELIIVNDGSTDQRTIEIFRLLRERGHAVLDQANAGLAAARNRGFAAANADYVLPLDADNRLRQGFLESALDLLDADSRVAVVYGDRRDFGQRNEVVDVPAFDLDAILPFNFVDACALIRRRAWQESAGYDGAMPRPGWEDWDFWLQLVAAGWELRHLPLTAFEYRVRPGSMLSGFDDESARRTVLRYVIEKHRDLYWRRLPEAFLAAQTAALDLSRMARAKEAAAAAHHSESAARGRAEGRVAALERQVSELSAGNDLLVGQNAQLLEDLGAWKTRVAGMEETLAWRLRSWIIRLKSRLASRRRLD